MVGVSVLQPTNLAINIIFVIKKAVSLQKELFVCQASEEDQIETTTLSILNDDLPEDEEDVYVYLTNPLGGVRIAKPSVDAGKMV